MKSMDLLEVFGSIRDKYILEAGKCREQSASVKMPRLPHTAQIRIAAMIALIFDSTAVSFGAVGTPVQMALSLLPAEVGTEAFVGAMSFWTALPHAVVGTFLPLIVLLMTTKFFSKDRSFKPALEAAPFAIFAGLSFAVPLLLISLFIGLIVALIVTASMKSGMKTIRRQDVANDYMISGSLQLTDNREMYLYRQVSRTEKPKENRSSGGGGSSTHRSSSGRSHGGSSGRF